MDRKYFESIRNAMLQMEAKKNMAPKSSSVDKAHYCATHVEHAEYGQGTCISEEHAEPAEDGSIQWYTVQFEGKEPMVVMTSEMKVLQAENHMHSKKKMSEDVEANQIEEAMSKEFEKEFANQPKGVEVHMHHPKTDRVTKEKFFGTHTAIKAAAKHISDMQKLGWKVKEKKLIESEESIEDTLEDIIVEEDEVLHEGMIELGGQSHNARRVPIKHYDEFKKTYPGSRVKFRGPKQGKDNTSKADATHFYVVNKKEKVQEAMQKSDVPAYLRKQKGEKPLSVADVKGARPDSISSKEALAKARNEETEGTQMKSVMDIYSDAISEAVGKKKATTPKSEKEKSLAALAEPKDKITHADVMVGRGVTKEEAELEEARFKKGQDVGAPGKNFEKIAKSAAAKYGSMEAGRKVAGAVLKKVLAKEEAELTQSVQLDELSRTTLNSYMKKSKIKSDELDHKIATTQSQRKTEKLIDKSSNIDAGRARAKTRLKGSFEPKQVRYNAEETESYAEVIEKFDDFTVQVKESYTFAEYLDAAKALVVEEDVIAVADAAYRAQDIDFVVEAFTQGEIEDKVAAHRKAGNKVTMPTFGKKKGEPYAEYVVTDKDGQKRKYIHHGKTRKVETLG